MNWLFAVLASFGFSSLLEGNRKPKSDRRQISTPLYHEDTCDCTDRDCDCDSPCHDFDCTDRDCDDNDDDLYADIDRQPFHDGLDDALDDGFDDDDMDDDDMDDE